MNNQIASLKKIRSFVLANIEGLSTEQLNHIPVGFNNNIIWNLAHMVAAMQGVCYRRSGLNIPDELFFDSYKPGSKPLGPVSAEEIGRIKELLINSAEQLDADYASGIFKTYTSFETRYGVAITGIDDAINFLPFHEGLHSGVISAMKKLV